MKVHITASEQVHGTGRTSPVRDEDFEGTHEDCAAVLVGFSYKHNTWAVVDCHGFVLAEGEPVELATWMQEYFTELGKLIESNAG